MPSHSTDSDLDQHSQFWERRIEEALNNFSSYRDSKIAKRSSEKVFKELGEAWGEYDRSQFLKNKAMIMSKQAKLKVLYKEKKENEKKKEGLVIINARYGVFDKKHRAIVDVTTPLQCFVNDASSTISFKKGPFESLPGFGNVTEGMSFPLGANLKKELQVIYRTNGSLRMKTFIEEEGNEVELP
ncbi:predicted protein [Naegleria gruberi]|uniref:Predicted protein n=1 Tax=Naegleria gruberi TaxID=5762 RepID=D2VH50_NAEGR|nr:uncharacterized protein NAEGRDRAFT_49540 [Naegleria gruberi]EFC43830.1 predicted protein [Naegleria gruberi]|eukprot:XP_002676574.1 predicted protein [Naegleria gruberi strain NEG-M]